MEKEVLLERLSYCESAQKDLRTCQGCHYYITARKCGLPELIQNAIELIKENEK